MKIKFVSSSPDVCIFSFNDYVVFSKLLIKIVHLYIIKPHAAYTKYDLVCLPLKGLFLRPGIFNKMSRIPEPQPQMLFVLAWTQLKITHNAEMKKLHPKCLTQWSKEHLYFLEGGQARFPAWFFHLTPHILDEVHIRCPWWPVNELDIGLPR
jgi:hypothetical protein